MVQQAQRRDEGSQLDSRNVLGLQTLERSPTNLIVPMRAANREDPHLRPLCKTLAHAVTSVDGLSWKRQLAILIGSALRKQRKCSEVCSTSAHACADLQDSKGEGRLLGCIVQQVFRDLTHLQYASAPS